MFTFFKEDYIKESICHISSHTKVNGIRMNTFAVIAQQLSAVWKILKDMVGFFSEKHSFKTF